MQEFDSYLRLAITNSYVFWCLYDDCCEAINNIKKINRDASDVNK